MDLPSCSSQYNANWDFTYALGGRQCQMVFTSVAGHLTELDFPASHKGWRSCSPLDLFAVPVHKTVPGVSHGGDAWAGLANSHGHASGTQHVFEESSSDL
jgi:hypothetical protein